MIIFALCAVTKLSDIITSSSGAEVAKRSKRKSSGETSAPPPKKKTQGQPPKTSAKETTPTTAAQSSSAAAAAGSTSVPEGVPLGVTTALPPQHGRGKQLKAPVNAVTATSLWNRYHSPPVFSGKDKSHSGEQWCPDWSLKVNDRCSNPRVAQDLVMQSTLPRDLDFTRKLTPAEMLQSVMVTTASNTAFVAEMAHRYCELLEEQDTGKLQDQIVKLKKKLVVSESEKSELQRQLKEAEAKGEEAEITTNSLRSALEEEQKRAEEAKKNHEQSLDSARTSAVEDFRRSETFIGDLGQLTRPSFMLGFTSAIDQAAAHLPSEALESLRNSAHYNEDSTELCDRMAEGIRAGRNLAEVQDEFNKWLSELDEAFEEERGEEADVGLGEGTGEVPGGNIGEEHGEELHPGGEEAGEKAAQEGAEKGNGAETGV